MTSAIPVTHARRNAHHQVRARPWRTRARPASEGVDGETHKPRRPRPPRRPESRRISPWRAHPSANSQWSLGSVSLAAYALCDCGVCPAPLPAPRIAIAREFTDSNSQMQILVKLSFKPWLVCPALCLGKNGPRNPVVPPRPPHNRPRPTFPSENGLHGAGGMS